MVVGVVLAATFRPTGGETGVRTTGIGRVLATGSPDALDCVAQSDGTRPDKIACTRKNKSSEINDSKSPRFSLTPYSGTSMIPAYSWLRNSMPIACDVSGRPRRFVNPHVLACLRSCSFVKRPVAYSSNARRTSGARSGSVIRLLPIARGAFRYPIGAWNTPAFELQRSLHAGPRAVRAHVVVELREGGKHALHQFASGRVVDRLRRRAQRDAKRLQVRAQSEVVVFIAREAHQVEHDHEVHAPLFSRQNVSRF